MNPKQLIIVGTMALVISISTIIQDDRAYAGCPTHPLDKSSPSAVSAQDDFHQALGVDSDEAVYDALYEGKSLADIAADNNKDVQPLIDLQMAQLAQQLDIRYASGSLTEQQYESHKAELRRIISDSVYGKQ